MVPSFQTWFMYLQLCFITFLSLSLGPWCVAAWTYVLWLSPQSVVLTHLFTEYNSSVSVGLLIKGCMIPVSVKLCWDRDPWEAILLNESREEEMDRLCLSSWALCPAWVSAFCKAWSLGNNRNIEGRLRTFSQLLKTACHTSSMAAWILHSADCEHETEERGNHPCRGTPSSDKIRHLLELPLQNHSKEQWGFFEHVRSLWKFPGNLEVRRKMKVICLIGSEETSLLPNSSFNAPSSKKKNGKMNIVLGF